MKEFRGVVLFLVTECINYILIYTILFNARITKNLQKLAVGFISIFGIHTIAYLLVSEQFSYSLSLATMILIPVFILNERRKEYFILYPFVLSLANIVGISTAFLMSLFLQEPIDDILQLGAENILCQFMQTLVLLAVFIIVLLRNRNWCDVRFRKSQYVILNIVAIVSLFGIGAVENLCGNRAYSKNAAVSGLAISITEIILICAVIILGITEERRMIAENRIQFSEQIAFVQKEHYEKIVAKDEQLKKFRHDVRAHVAVLKSYAKERDYEGISEYLKKVEEFSDKRKKFASTGNNIFDAIVESFMDDIDEKGIRLSVNGVFGTLDPIYDMDLGIIVFNLIKNAYEACINVEERMRFIDIKLGVFNNRRLLNIVNSTNGIYKTYNNELITTKADDYYHGYGIQNVKTAVDKLGGSIDFNMGNDVFDVTLII